MVTSKFLSMPSKTRLINAPQGTFTSRALQNHSFKSAFLPTPTNKLYKLEDGEFVPVFPIAFNKTFNRYFSNRIKRKFRNEYLTTKEIITNIGTGYAFICSHIKPTSKNKFNRNKKIFLNAEIFAIDVNSDNGKEPISISDFLDLEIVKSNCLLIFINENPPPNKFTALFNFNSTLYEAMEFKKIVTTFIDVLKSDISCTEPLNINLGNRNSMIIDIKKNKIYYSTNGVINNE